MRKVWDIRLYAYDNQLKAVRYRVDIRDPQDRLHSGNGMSPHAAYRDCELRMVVKPGFHLSPETVTGTTVFTSRDPMSYIITGLICLVVGFVAGMVVQWVSGDKP